jgi:S1-C subfamily serine protease
MRHARVEVFQKQWDILSAGKPVETSPSDLTEVRTGFEKIAPQVAPLLVEVFADKKPVALGTIVTGDGMVATIATGLDGKLSCRLADGRLASARVHKVSKEHGLALLKIDGATPTTVRWSDADGIPPGTLVAALAPGERPVVGVVAVPLRSIPSGAGRSELRRVFSTDIVSPRNLAGGPVVDRSGRPVGIALAGTDRGLTHVVPSALVEELTK